LKIGIRLCVDGTPVYHDIKSLQTNKPNVVIGTPGRLLDILSNEKKNILSYLKYLVIDEADEMFLKGIAINFLGRTEVPILREIEEYYNTAIDEMPKDISEFFN